jgi:hypothetical protein
LGDRKTEEEIMKETMEEKPRILVCVTDGNLHVALISENVRALFSPVKATQENAASLGRVIHIITNGDGYRLDNGRLYVEGRAIMPFPRLDIRILIPLVLQLSFTQASLPS